MKILTAISGFKTDWRNFLRGRRLAFKLGVIATLAIAIGANIAVLGNLGVLFGPTVPGATHKHFLEPWMELTAFKALPSDDIGIFRPVYDELEKSLHDRAQTALYQLYGGTLSAINGPTQRLAYLRVTPSLAEVLGVRPVAGRLLNAGDSRPGAAPVMVISNHLAQARFGSADAAPGHRLSLNGKTYTVVGVLPGNLEFPSGSISFGEDTSAWLPFTPEAAGSINHTEMQMYALVRPGADLSRAALRDALALAYRQVLPRYTAEVQRNLARAGVRLNVSTLAEREFGPVISRLQLLGFAALLLLLLVIANLAGLATTDTLARRQEFATRTALGASVLQIYWGRACELLELAVIGWAIGMTLGWLGSRALAVSVGQAGPSAVFSLPVLLATLGAVIVIALLLSTAGMRRMRTPGAVAVDIASGSRATGGRSMARTLRALVVIQLALSLILMVTAAHLQANVFGLKHGDLGFTPSGRTFIGVALPGGEGSQNDAQYEAYVKQAFVFDQALIERMQALPGVKTAALLSLAPLSEGDMNTDIRSAPNAKPQIINHQAVSRDIVSALGLQVLAGNPDSIFTGEKSALLDESAVEALWPGMRPEQAVGRSVYLGNESWTIAAVVQPLRMRAYGSVGGTIFQPISAKAGFLSGGPQRFVINSGLASQALRSELEKMVQQINPQAKILEFDSADALIAKAYAGRERLSQIFGLVALVTLVIAAVGLFALLAYRALMRRPEFAIRGALGATPARLFLYVLAEAAALWIIGCVIGIPLAYVLSAQLAVHLPELGALAPWLVASVAAALGLAAAVAAFVPALRASRVELSTSLK